MIVGDEVGEAVWAGIISGVLEDSSNVFAANGFFGLVDAFVEVLSRASSSARVVFGEKLSTALERYSDDANS